MGKAQDNLFRSTRGPVAPPKEASQNRERPRTQNKSSPGLGPPRASSAHKRVYPPGGGGGSSDCKTPFFAEADSPENRFAVETETFWRVAPRARRPRSGPANPKAKNSPSACVTLHPRVRPVGTTAHYRAATHTQRQADSHTYTHRHTHTQTRTHPHTHTHGDPHLMIDTKMKPHPTLNTPPSLSKDFSPCGMHPCKWPIWIDHTINPSSHPAQTGHTPQYLYP